MGKRPIKCRVGPVELGQGAFMQSVETVEQPTQFQLKSLIFGIVAEGGAADEFSHGQFSRLRGPPLNELLVTR